MPDGLGHSAYLYPRSRPFGLYLSAYLYPRPRLAGGCVLMTNRRKKAQGTVPQQIWHAEIRARAGGLLLDHGG